jgi:ankyrin repeat protein
MSMKRVIEGCAVGLMLSMASLGAAGSDVADAVMAGDTAALRTLLAQRADVNTVQGDGATALHWAVYREDLETANLLIRAGANVKAANREGVTPLALACMNGNAALVETLLNAGADANERLLNGETALMMASRTGNVAAMKVLLDHGANLNAKEGLRGTTALMWAAAQGHPAAVQLLIERGADMSARSNPDWRGKVVSYAKAEDPRPSRKKENVYVEPKPTDMSDRSGGALTALVFAARRNDLDSVRVLLAAGAVGGDPESPLPARGLPSRQGRRPEHR